jgi:ABC-type amino acid transport system permease subunit
VQYGRWLWAVLHGDLGRSFIDNTPVADALWQRLPVTIELAIGSFLVAVIIAVPAGILSAARPRGWANAIGTLIALFGMSVPHFWLGMLFIILFAVKLGWLPASGFVPLSVDWHANLVAMIMPMVVTGLRESAILMRMVRSSLLEVLNEDYIRTAFSKGLRDWQVVLGRAAQCHDPGGHGQRPDGLRHAGRTGHHREHLRHSRHGQDDRRRHLPARLRDCAGRCAGRHRDGGHRQPVRGPALQRDRPAHRPLIAHPAHPTMTSPDMNPPSPAGPAGAAPLAYPAPLQPQPSGGDRCGDHRCTGTVGILHRYWPGTIRFLIRTTAICCLVPVPSTGSVPNDLGRDIYTRMLYGSRISCRPR